VDFELSEQHAILQSTLRQFFRERVAPRAREWDEAERFPSEIIPELAELGLLGIKIPEEYGGAGLDMSAYAIAVEEAARVDGSLALTLASHNGLGTGHIVAVGTEAQKQKYLTKAASGEWLAAWALTEPGSGSDSAALRTTAVRDGDAWIISGSKMFITQGSVGGFCVVLARTNQQVQAQRGISAFIVEATTPGYSASKKLKKLGCRSSDTVEVTLDQVRVSDEQRLGEVDQGFADTMRILDGGRVSIAAMALGLGRGALEMAIRYAKEREAFGKSISEFQAIQWMLADARKRSWTRQNCWFDARLGWRTAAGASLPKRPWPSYSPARWRRVCNNSLQIHGGYGYTREYDIERHLRDAKLCEIGEGTSQVQRIVIAKHLLRD